MENVKPSSASVAIKWAVFNILTGIVVTYAFQFSGIDQSSPIRYVSFLPFIAFLLLAQKEYRERLGGFMTFGEGFMPGFLFAVFAGLFSAVFIYVYLGILSPHVFEASMVDAQAKMEAKGTMSSEQIETAMSISRKYGVLLAAVGTVFVTAIMGAIIALIGAAIFKKERSVLDIEQANNYSDPAV